MPGYALIFPGQGSQYAGMGKDLYEAFPAARALYDEADRLWGGPLSSLIFTGPADQLTETVNAQPALFVTSLASLAALHAAVGEPRLQPAFVAGHSLGEYSALAAAGALSFADGFALVRARGQAMKAAGEIQPGGMAAVLGVAAADLEAICAEAGARVGAPVGIANDNAPGQIVISGAHAAVAAAGELAKARGAKRVVPLAVSIAAHSPLMVPASERFAPALRSAALTPPGAPVVGNCQAQPLSSVADIVAELAAQLTSPVRWTASIQYMVERGVSIFIEVGPKDVLTGLVKRIAPSATCIPCGTVSAVEQVAAQIRAQAGQA